MEGLVVAYVIKRYANRKLYDPQKSQYVTLEELEETALLTSLETLLDGMAAAVP